MFRWSRLGIACRSDRAWIKSFEYAAYRVMVQAGKLDAAPIDRTALREITLYEGNHQMNQRQYIDVIALTNIKSAKRTLEEISPEITDGAVDPTELARVLGVLAKWEKDLFIRTRMLDPSLG